MSDKPVNSNCYIQLQILEANFLKDDGDAFGKQDPFVKFIYNGKPLRTATHDDAGKHAKFTEVFKLEEVDKPIKENFKIVFEAYDEDPTSDDLLSKTDPIPFSDFIKSDQQQNAKFDLFEEKKHKLAGHVLV